MKHIQLAALLLIILFCSYENSYSQDKKLFHGFGTEPFWGIDVTETRVKFFGLDADTLFFDYNNIRHATGFTKEYYYEFPLLSYNQHAGVLIISKLNNCECSDGMSDNQFEFECILILEKSTYRGCAVRGK